MDAEHLAVMLYVLLEKPTDPGYYHTTVETRARYLRASEYTIARLQAELNEQHRLIAAERRRP